MNFYKFFVFSFDGKSANKLIIVLNDVYMFSKLRDSEKIIPEDICKTRCNYNKVNKLSILPFKY